MRTVEQLSRTAWASLRIDDEKSEREGRSGILSGVGGRCIASSPAGVIKLPPNKREGMGCKRPIIAPCIHSQSAQRSCPSRGLPGTGTGTYSSRLSLTLRGIIALAAGLVRH